MPEQLSLPAGAARSSPDPYGDDWDAGFLDAVVTLLDDRPSASPAAPPVPSASMPRGPAGAGGPAASAEIMPAAMSPVIVAGPRPLVRHVELELDVDEADAQRNRPSAEGSRDDSGADDMVVDVVASGESTRCVILLGLCDWMAVLTLALPAVALSSLSPRPSAQHDARAAQVALPALPLASRLLFSHRPLCAGLVRGAALPVS